MPAVACPADVRRLWLGNAGSVSRGGRRVAQAKSLPASAARGGIRATVTQNPEVAVQSIEQRFKALRDGFAILAQRAHDKPLVYLDSAATSQKPLSVLTAMDDYYRTSNANVHRGVHYLSQLATEQYEASRAKIASFVNASSPSEIVFTRNATEAINLVAASWGGANIKEGDEILLTAAEHHSNIVPWQLLAQRTGAVLRFAPLVGTGAGVQVDYEQLLDMVGERTRLVAVHHVSNVLGCLSPLPAIIERAHTVGAKVLADACQSVPHMPVDVQLLGVDFLVASSHKMLGPMGVGFLYAPLDTLAGMPPYQGGGEMIADVFLDRSTYAEPPARFEAGTPAVAEAVGLGAAIDYLQALGMEAVHEHELRLVEHLYAQLSSVDGVSIYGPPPASLLPPGSRDQPHLARQAALCAFNVEGIHPTDISTFLDQQHGVAIRSGHHCAQPIHHHLNVGASARASCYIYNTKEEINAFIEALKDTVSFFSSFK